MFCTVLHVQFVLSSFQKLKVKLLQHETHIISETTNDISYPILYFSHPIGPSGVGRRQGDNTGKGILPTPPSMGEDVDALLLHTTFATKVDISRPIVDIVLQTRTNRGNLPVDVN